MWIFWTNKVNIQKSEVELKNKWKNFKIEERKSLKCIEFTKTRQKNTKNQLRHVVTQNLLSSETIFISPQFCTHDIESIIPKSRMRVRMVHV